MKKSLAVIVAGAMAFSMFASAAFAADEQKNLTALEKFNALKDLGVFEGYPGGGAGLENEMTRAEFSKVLTKIKNLQENPGAANVYSDVSATHWAKGFIGAVTADGIMEGLGNKKFGPSGKVTIEQVAKVADEVAGLEQSDEAVKGAVSAWAKGYVAAAIKAGLLTELPSYKTNATREMLVNVTYDLVANGGGVNIVTVKSTKVIDDKNIEVTFSDDQVVKKTLDTALVAGQATKVSVEYNGKTYQVEVKLDVLLATEAKQTGAKKITVNFNQPVTDADKTNLTYELKYSLAPYPVTAEYAVDGKSAVLTAAYLPAGDYTLTVKGSSAISLKVVEEAPTKIDITAPALQKAANQDLGVKLYNQFGEAMTTSAQITSYNVTKNKALPDGGTLDLSSDANAAIGDTITVNAIYPVTGLSVTKSLKVINGSAATSIKLGTVVPLKDTARISTSQTGLVLPLELIDQNGQKIKLPSGTISQGTANTFAYAGLIFYVSNPNLITDLTVDADGIIHFNTKTITNPYVSSETVYITITNGATGANAQTTVVVNAPAVVKEFQLQHPGKTVVQGESIAFPFTAVDTYGATIAPKDLSLANVRFAGLGITDANQPKINAKGELIFNFPQAGNIVVYVTVNGLQQSTSVPVTVNAPSYFTAVNGIKDIATTFEVGAKAEFDADNITIVDNYGRVSNVTAGTYTVKSSNDAIVTYNAATGKLEAGTTAGTATITVSSTANAGGANASKAITNYTFTVTTIASSDIKSYGIDTVGTVYGKSDAADGNAHAKAITLVGKTAGGTTVVLKSNVPTFVTSSVESVLKVSNANNTNVYGLKAGKSTVAAYFNGTKVAEQEVTVSDEAPVVAKVELSKDEYTTTQGGIVTIAATVKDQYGVAIVAPYQVLTSDSSVATVSGLNVTGVKKGSATLTYVSSNGTQATATIVVN